MSNIAAPMAIMGCAGLLLAWYHFRKTGNVTAEDAAVRFDNPFSSKSAINFALIFATILMLTRLANHNPGGE